MVQPIVTVLMAVHNCERYIAAAVESILRQSFTFFEFLIVDDGSTDLSSEILESYNDSRIRIIRNESNLGLAASLNKGIEHASSEYIARMDADDISLPERLGTQLRFLKEHPNIGIVGTYANIIDAKGRFQGKIKPPILHGAMVWALCFGSVFVHPSVMFKKSVVIWVGGYNVNLRANQDRDLWQRLSGFTKFANIPKTLLLYRCHEQNISTVYGDTQAYNSANAGQRMMSEIFGTPVSLDMCLNIRLGRYNNIEDAVEVAHLIYPLYRRFVSTTNLSSSEKKIIRWDAARRLVSLIWRWKGNREMRRLLITAIRLDRMCLFKGFGRKVKWKLLKLAKNDYPKNIQELKIW